MIMIINLLITTITLAHVMLITIHDRTQQTGHDSLPLSSPSVSDKIGTCSPSSSLAAPFGYPYRLRRLRRLRRVSLLSSSSSRRLVTRYLRTRYTRLLHKTGKRRPVCNLSPTSSYSFSSSSSSSSSPSPSRLSGH